MTHQEFLQDDITAKFGLSGEEQKLLEGPVNQIPIISPERARALSEMLLHAASWISGISVASFIRSEEKIQQQSRIGEYIQELKAGSKTQPYYPLEKERRLIGTDLNEAAILKLMDSRPDTRFAILVTVIGAQGYLFGRGNQQLSPRVIRRAGKRKYHCHGHGEQDPHS